MMYDSNIITQIMLAVGDFVNVEEIGMNDDLERDLSINEERKKVLAQMMEKKFNIGNIYESSFEKWKSVKDVVSCVYGYVCDRMVTID